eukprot:scaffold3337_cov169-Amphora_coffeaeformis.AAC.9
MSDASAEDDAAEQMVAGAKQEIETAEQKVAAAKQEVEVAEQKVAAAKQNYKEASDEFIKGLAQKEWESAQKERESALLLQDIAIKRLGRAQQRLDNILDQEVDGRQHQRKPPRTPRLRRGMALVPPSTGKEPKEESNPKASPSSDEGIAEGLSRVAASPSMRASSNSVSIDFVQDLHKITKRNEIEEKFHIAANYVRKNWHNMRYSMGKKGVYKNERWLTGIVCNALNLVLQANGGLVALHQGCIGSGSTHSDISVSAVGQEQSPPLLVCEGKQDSDINVRDSVRGQLFNELVRHRTIFARGSGQNDYRPVLLMALNTSYVSLELAFPTTKNGRLKGEDWITPEFNADGEVVFFTIQIALINIDDDTEGRKKLAQLFCFLESALKKLRDMKDYGRDQWKTPWVNNISVTSNVSKKGDNVTVVDEKRVYKEFCYYLRQKDDFNTIAIQIEKQDQRKPPPKTLLQLLGKPYSDWICREYAGGWFVVLEYDYIPGDHQQVTKASWMSLLRRIATLHNNGYVHGDILPRNMLFSGNEGYIIDFDLMRQEGQQYVLGYNYVDFEKYRHTDAQAQKQMKKTHDVHALTIIAVEYFGDDADALLGGKNITSIQELISIFDSWSFEGSHEVNPDDSTDPLDASSSPVRD